MIPIVSVEDSFGEIMWEQLKNQGYNGSMHKKQCFFLSSRGREELYLSNLCVTTIVG